ncbi:gas vesicle protein K, partial [Streptomyces violaceoruber]
MSEPAEPRKRRLDLEPDTVERDLIKLVLTVVELLRQLMERQALRRVDEGDLSEDQEERIGLTLMLLDDRMTELRDRYGLRPED